MAQLDGVLLEVADLERSLDFYRTIGLAVPRRGVTAVPGPCRLEWVLGPGSPPLPEVRVAGPGEVDAVAHRVRLAGHRVVREAWDAPWGARVADLADPDGGLVRVYAPYP